MGLKESILEMWESYRSASQIDMDSVGSVERLSNREIFGLALEVDEWQYIARGVRPGFSAEKVCYGSVGELTVEIRKTPISIFNPRYEIAILCQGQELNNMRRDFVFGRDLKREMERLYRKAEKQGKERIELAKRQREAEIDMERTRAKLDLVSFVRTK
ncbi:MAG: hypothetical protein ABIA93_07980 [Candidatus Woesearchaeota archaeon]